jgi:vacuolar-type H+-ATPase subunit D/Vma8
LVNPGLKRLHELEKKYKVLQQEHELLKKPSGSLPNEIGNLVHRNEPATYENKSNFG